MELAHCAIAVRSFFRLWDRSGSVVLSGSVTTQRVYSYTYCAVARVSNALAVARQDSRYFEAMPSQVLETLPEQRLAYAASSEMVEQDPTNGYFLSHTPQYH